MYYGVVIKICSDTTVVWTLSLQIMNRQARDMSKHDLH